MKFTHLHVHSHYSLLDGLAKIDDLIDRVKELGMDSCALTDHGVLYGAVEFYKKAKAAGIKPIIGAELYLALEDMDQKRPNIDDKRYHITLLVKNDQGYQNLVKLITKAHLRGFYYKPRIDEQTLFERNDGLICLSGCLVGKIPRLIISNKTGEAEKTALRFKQAFGPDNFYLELQHHANLPEQDKANKQMVEISKKHNIPLVATDDVHYMRQDDAEAQDILMLINTGSKPDDPERLTMKADDFSMKPGEKIAQAFKDAPSAITNTQKIVDQCNFNFKLGETRLPYFETSNSQTADEYLKELCVQGLEHKKGRFENINQAKERMEYELSVIKQTGFASYFLIVQDFVNWAKQNRIVVGPGRGSAGGSLAAYLLNITEVDPLKHDLLFERFLASGRISLPDIDLDFTDRRRDEVIEYIADKYGRDKVAQIITFGTMAAKAVVRDVGRALALPYSYCDQIAKMIPFGMTLDQALEKVPEFQQMYQTDDDAKKLINFSKKLEGCARHASTHACGVVISKEPLDNIVPLQHPTQDDRAIVTQYEMHSIDALGLLKMDLLGLKNLTIIEDTLVRIYKVHNKSFKISEVPFDDKKTYQLLQQGKSTGIFQMESSGFKRYLKQLKPTVFDDIVAMVALYRPGPMQFIPEYIDRKHKKKNIEYLHPKLEPILSKTQGICVFQEQLMQIARDLAGFTLSEADVLRKAVGKKIKSLLITQKEKFIIGMIKNNIDNNTAQRIWEWILPFAQYGFNRSHSVAYGMIGYYTAFLKAHYPVEFMAALLTSEKTDIERIAFLIDECKDMGIEVLAPDINESFRNFSVIPGKNQIRFGLFAIKNVGANIVDAIIAERKNGPFQSFTDFASRIDCKDFNKKSLESLIKAGVFDKFEERNKLLENIEQILSFNRDTRKLNNSNQQNLFAKEVLASTDSLRLNETEPMSTDQKLIWEKDLLGLYISSHPLESIRTILEQKTFPLKGLKQGIVNQKIRVGGIISSIKKILTKKGQPMLFLQLEDLTDKAEVIVFPSALERNGQSIAENKIVFVSGRVDNWRDNPKIIAEDIEEIIEK